MVKKILTLSSAFLVTFIGFLALLPLSNIPIVHAACTPQTSGFSYTLSTQNVIDNTATLIISPALGAPAVLEYIPVPPGNERSQPLNTGATSAQITGADGFYTARINYLGVCITSNVTFSLPDNNGSDLPGGGGGAECSSFLNCVDTKLNPAPKYANSSGFLGKLVSDILPIALILGGFLSVIIIVISGIQFITSSGNPDGAAAARSRLTYAIIGFVLLTLAYGITAAIDTIFLRGSGVF